MQKDMHYYMVNYLARKAGISPEISNKIAWACQFVDDQTHAKSGRIQTQCAIEIDGNWDDPHVQQTVLAAFHFLPGDFVDTDMKITRWVTQPNSKLARLLLKAAIETKNPYRIGIAIHAMQDTFSHQGFTAFEEKFNSCFGWDNLVAFGIPSIGHADVRRSPDIMNAKWVDPRYGDVIDNAVRGQQMANVIYETLCQTSDCDNPKESFPLYKDLSPFWSIKSYDKRKQWLKNGGEMPRYSQFLTRNTKVMTNFTSDARQHLALALQHFPDELTSE